jgi:hypothetical protein
MFYVHKDRTLNPVKVIFRKGRRMRKNDVGDELNHSML